MSHVRVEIVIACHDLSRPIERAVSSVLHDARVRDRIRVTVVGHGLAASELEQRLSEIDGAIRVVSFTDGVRSPAGPFNHGLSLVDADYCGVMGSDDFLEPGTMSAWIDHVDAEKPDAAIAKIRLQGEAVMPNPLVRIGRAQRLDATKDRLFYRTAPLGLVLTERMRELGLRMIEGLRVGEDFDFGIRLWAHGGRIDYLAQAPCYVIGQDATDRTTYAPMTIAQRFEPIVRLISDGLPESLTPRHRKSLAIKLTRISVIGAAHALAETDITDGDVREISDHLNAILAMASGVLSPFNRQDRFVLDALLTEPTVERLRLEVTRARKAGRIDRWLTVNPLYSFHRESMLRRYVLYVLKRERGARAQ